jgi:hypothetical protein
VSFANGCFEIGIAVERLIDPELLQVFGVLDKRRRKHLSAGVRRELDEEASDAACRPDHQHLRLLLQGERVERRERGDTCKRRGSGMRHLEIARLRGDRVVLGNGDELSPAAVVDAGVCVGEKAEHLVVDLVAADALAHLLDDAGEVATKSDRELVLDHVLEKSAGDRDVGTVHRGGADAHKHLEPVWARCRQVVTQSRLFIEAI